LFKPCILHHEHFTSCHLDLVVPDHTQAGVLQSLQALQAVVASLGSSVALLQLDLGEGMAYLLAVVEKAYQVGKEACCSVRRGKGASGHRGRQVVL
jgi:hypothetical protein